MKNVLFACIHNAGRSQMAAAWFNALVNPELARGISAGTEPGTRVHPEVLEAMREGKAIARVREIRDEVRDRVLQLLTAEGWARDSSSSPA
jgi:arsenate reductase